MGEKKYVRVREREGEREEERDRERRKEEIGRAMKRAMKQGTCHQLMHRVGGNPRVVARTSEPQFFICWLRILRWFNQASAVHYLNALDTGTEV